MKTLNIASEIGSIDYRMPNVPEAMELLGRMGIDGGSVSEDLKNGFIIVSKCIANMGKFIIKVDCTIDDEKITDFEELCNKYEAMQMLTQVASKILECAKGLNVESKKKSSKTRS